MKWIRRYDNKINMYIDAQYVCSNCLNECFSTEYYHESILTPYCPWCGKKAEGKDSKYIYE